MIKQFFFGINIRNLVTATKVPIKKNENLQWFIDTHKRNINNTRKLIKKNLLIE